jgi:murein DD-endopeptidase MepM/ murein hydrolase activator NlpD
MTNFTLSLGRNQLAVSFGRKPGRPKRTLAVKLGETISLTKRLVTSRRYAGHPASRVLRRVFEFQKIRAVLGLNLAFIALFSGILIPPISALDANPEEEIVALSPGEAQVTTQEGIHSPLRNFKVSQGYSFFHPGIDLDEELGAEIYPIMNGQVEDVSEGRFGYGRSILVNHGNNLKSFYAHLNQINVYEGEEVTKETVIGTVGRSGWATGTHLHLEIHDNGRTINPLVLLR